MKKVLFYFGLIILTIISILLSLLMLFTADAPPLENDYTWSDVVSTTNPTTAIMRELQNMQFTNVRYEKERDNILDFEDEIEQLWNETEHVRARIRKAIEYDFIVYDTAISNIRNSYNTIRDILRLYNTYVELKIAKEEFEEILTPLEESDALIRKLMSRCPSTQFKYVMLMNHVFVLSHAHEMINNTNCLSHIKNKLITMFTPLSDEEMSLKNAAIGQYVYAKYTMPEHIYSHISASWIPSTNNIMRYVLFHDNTTISEMRKGLDMYLQCATNRPLDFSKYSSYVYTLYRPFDFLNMFGRQYARSSCYVLLYYTQRIIEYYIRSDIILMGMHHSLGKSLILDDPYTNKPYKKKINDNSYYSAGPDGIYDTHDDIDINGADRTRRR